MSFRVFCLVAAFAAAAMSPAGAAQRVAMPLAPAARGATPSDGITVSAQGSATAQADVAVVTIRFYSQKSDITVDSLQPIVDALVKIGIDRKDVTIPLAQAPQGTPANTAEMIVTVNRPTGAMIRDALPALVTIAQSKPNWNGSAEVVLQVDNCSKYADAATAAAIKTARQRAESAAKDLGVNVGAVRAFSSSEQTLTPAGACTTTWMLGGYNANNAMRSLDDFTLVRVISSVTIRYAIR